MRALHLESLQRLSLEKEVGVDVPAALDIADARLVEAISDPVLDGELLLPARGALDEDAA
jgi:hypothetical protein